MLAMAGVAATMRSLLYRIYGVIALILRSDKERDDEVGFERNKRYKVGERTFAVVIKSSGYIRGIVTSVV